jgi:hypothetical protein
MVEGEMYAFDSVRLHNLAFFGDGEIPHIPKRHAYCFLPSYSY